MPTIKIQLLKSLLFLLISFKAAAQRDQAILFKKLGIKKVIVVKAEGTKPSKFTWILDKYGNNIESSEYRPPDTGKIQMQWKKKNEYDSKGDLAKTYSFVSVSGGIPQQGEIENPANIEFWISVQKKDDTIVTISYNKDGSIEDISRSVNKKTGRRGRNDIYVTRTDHIYYADSGFKGKATHRFNFWDQYLEYRYYNAENKITGYTIRNYNSKGLLTYEKEWEKETGVFINSYYRHKYNARGQVTELTELDSKKRPIRRSWFTYYSNGLIKTILTRGAGQADEQEFFSYE
jgi:hypothetical protein